MRIIEQKDRNQSDIELDHQGYFLIKPNYEDAYIYLEHYDYDNNLLHKIRGKTARNVYWIVLEHGWISDLSHAAYLGKELAFAECSIRHQTKYVQN